MKPDRRIPFGALVAAALVLGALRIEAQAPLEPVPQTVEGRALASFHAALAAGRALVTVWGASHVASDAFTGPMRDALVAAHGDGGPGQFFPARPLTLYDRRDVRLDDGEPLRGVSTRGHRVEDDYGRAGIALDTTHGGRACARLVHGTTVTSVEAWATGRAAGAALTLEVDGASVTVAARASLSRARLAVHGAEEICIAVRGAVRSYGVIADADRGVAVESFGVPGARARDARLWRERTFADQLAARPPDLAVVAYGTNESVGHRARAALHADMSALLARLHRAAPGASCLVIGPSDRDTPETSRVRDAYRDAAREGGCAFFDLLAWTGGPGTLPVWAAHGLALSDRVHFTDETYARLGRDLARAIDVP